MACGHLYKVTKINGTEVSIVVSRLTQMKVGSHGWLTGKILQDYITNQANTYIQL